MNKYDINEWQWWDYKTQKPIFLHEMSTEELQQALCYCMEVIERVESSVVSQTQLLEQWRDGDLYAQYK